MDKNNDKKASHTFQAEGEYTANEIKKDLLRLYASSTYQKLNEYYRRENVFNILGKSRDENAHSDFLAWLLDSHSSHGLGTYPMEMFLRMIGVAMLKPFNKLASPYPNEFSLGTIFFSKTPDIIEVNVIREERTSKGQYIDLSITVMLKDGRFVHVIIENKVKSVEHDKAKASGGLYQTEVYYEDIIERIKKYNNKDLHGALFVFLTPKPSVDLECLKEQECKNKNFIQINYQFLLDLVISPCMNRKLDDDTRYLMENYIRCLSDPYYYDEEDDLIMGNSEEEKELLRAFLNENKRLIQAAIGFGAIDEKRPEEERDEWKEAGKYIRSAELKGKSYQYIISIEGKTEIVSSQRQMPLHIIKRYVEKHPGTTAKELIQLLKDVKPQPSGGLVGDISENGKAKDGYNLWLQSPNKEINRYFYDEELLKSNIVVSTEIQQPQFASLLKWVDGLPKEEFPWTIEKIE